MLSSEYLFCILTAFLLLFGQSMLDIIGGKSLLSISLRRFLFNIAMYGVVVSIIMWVSMLRNNISETSIIGLIGCTSTFVTMCYFRHMHY